jgi:hypothetical protein
LKQHLSTLLIAQSVHTIEAGGMPGWNHASKYLPLRRRSRSRLSEIIC